MGFVNAVLGQVFGSGLALLEEQAMRHRAGIVSERQLADAAQPYLDRIAATGAHPHFSAWAADPARHAPAPPTFEQLLDWVLDGLTGLLPDAR